MQLTDRDREILIALTHKVRLMSLDQIARTWWGNSPSALATARKRLTVLSAYALQRMKLNAHPELTLTGPLFAWQPGQATPHFGGLSYRLKKRWDQAPVPTTVYIATEKAARQFGGFGGKLRRPLQATHDLHVAQLYLQFLQTAPERAALWVSEERFAPERRHEKLPDAVLRDATGNITLVIEFGGAYDSKHVERVHLDCVTRSLPYELW
ncbi:MAG: hypothetical protein H6973_18210 [Gammaproteobacteria bacterium]|nr:hypothetical protein [Gammaproteobacteria bacterium]